MALDFETINRIARDFAADVSRKLPVDKVFLFGPCVNGRIRECKDIDICFFLKNYKGKRRVDVLAQILNIGEEKYRGAFFKPIIFKTAEIKIENPLIREIIETGRVLLL